MITERDTEPGCDQQNSGYSKVKPVESEVPEIPRHSGERENKRADQEGAGDPVNPVDRDSQMQG